MEKRPLGRSGLRVSPLCLGDGSRSQTHRGLPLDEDVDRALGVMERFLRRFMNILREEKPDRT